MIDSIWLIIFSFGIFLGATAKFLTRFMYFCFCLSEDCIWVFIPSYVIRSYVIRSRLCQILPCGG